MNQYFHRCQLHYRHIPVKCPSLTAEHITAAQDICGSHFKIVCCSGRGLHLSLRKEQSASVSINAGRELGFLVQLQLGGQDGMFAGAVIFTAEDLHLLRSY